MSLELSVRIDASNPVHTRISIFTSQKRYGVEVSARGHSGQLVIDTEHTIEFIQRLKPIIITKRDSIDLDHLGLVEIDDGCSGCDSYIVLPEYGECLACGTKNGVRS